MNTSHNFSSAQLPDGRCKRHMDATEFGDFGPLLFQSMEAYSQLRNIVIETFQLLVLLMDEAASLRHLGRSRWQVF